MRNNVQRSLNRGESFHQLMSAIRRIGNKKIIGKTDVKLEINNECTRLIANCIIYYNTALLSNIYQEYKIQNQEENCEGFVASVNSS